MNEQVELTRRQPVAIKASCVLLGLVVQRLFLNKSYTTLRKAFQRKQYSYLKFADFLLKKGESAEENYQRTPVVMQVHEPKANGLPVHVLGR